MSNALVATFLLAISAAGQSQPPPKSAREASETIDSLRNEGRKLVATDPAAALKKFQQALTYFQQPLVKDLAKGDFFLGSRHTYIWFDLVETYSRLQQTPEALRWLQRIQDDGAWAGFAGFLEKQDFLAPLRADPAFQKLLATARQKADYWEPRALKTPFSTNLSDTEKIAGLSRFWSEVKYNFAYPEIVETIGWDQLYLDAIPKVLATKSTETYYLELMRFCALLKDGHTNVYFPKEVDRSSKPPVKTLLIDGRVGIVNVYAPSLVELGVLPGMEVLAVDGDDVHAYVKREVTPIQSASTPGDLDMRGYWYGFLRGPKDKPVRLKLRSRDGAVIEKELARSGYQTKYPDTFEYRDAADGVAYVRAEQFENPRIVTQWKEKFAQIRAAKSLIIDLRNNGGGSSSIGWAILSDLIDKPAHGAMTRLRRYVPTERAWGRTQIQFYSNPPANVEPSQGPKFTGPVIVLTSPATYSAAEDFLLAFRDSGRGRIVGETSGGSTGQPLFLNLPGGGSARICTKQDLAPDGTKWIGVGIKPDVEVKPRWDDFVQGRDTVLEAALKLLR
ncbi:MAG: hypothetical protein HY820_07310 [Acidobacteria bacterium]|nr:hypothetical protein [Acidobacteriota bacterium]